MEDRLKHIFGVVNEWLKFAEAKNAALLVAVAALSKPVLDHFPDKAALPTAWWCCTVGCGFLFLSGFLCLGSFLPQLTFKWGASKRPLMATDNLFYFGHIAHLSAFEYLEALYQAEATPPKNKKTRSRFSCPNSHQCSNCDQ